MKTLQQRLGGLIASPRAESDLRRYCGTGGGREVPFTGARFEHLAGGGDRPAVAVCDVVVWMHHRVGHQRGRCS
ncbi:hypothetical protein ACWEPM_28295 [Streptomyces sp. NPDC004244]|uniref:hypothetical protein n=1 Tax=Streptomyces sp. NPDC101206 TaxID=3366128 RepID=UPI00380C4786